MPIEETMNIDGFSLVCSCGACPESYNVFRDKEHVGYLRLRHGYFRAEHNGEVVYEANPRGDGIFEEEERSEYLTAAVKAIKKSMIKKSMIKDPFTVEISSDQYEAVNTLIRSCGALLEWADGQDEDFLPQEITDLSTDLSRLEKIWTE